MVPPLAALAVDESCQLNCCRGAGRHSAGSCAGSACHLESKKKSAPSEIICGGEELKKLAEKQIAAEGKYKNYFADQHSHGVPVFDETQTTHSRGEKDSSLLQTKKIDLSCETVCSLSSFQSNQQNQRDSDQRVALSAFADKPRPPTVSQTDFLRDLVAQNSQKISCRPPARAPPVSFS